MKKITAKQTIKREEEYLPKGCRKLRTRLVDEVVELSIGYIDECEAPVAFVVHEFKISREVRLYKGKFYAQEVQHTMDGERLKCFADLRLTFDTRYDGCLDHDREKKQRQEWAKMLVIGNYIYRQCAQPYYSWHMFGIGDSWCFSAVIPRDEYQDYELKGISPDDREALMEKYEDINSHCVHKYESLEDALDYNSIEVVMPECCKRKFQPGIYEGGKWYDGLSVQLRKDIQRFMAKKMKEYAKHFRYLSHEDFAYRFKDAAEAAVEIERKKIG